MTPPCSPAFWPSPVRRASPRSGSSALVAAATVAATDEALLDALLVVVVVAEVTSVLLAGDEFQTVLFSMFRLVP